MTSIPLTKPHAAKKGFKVAVMGAALGIATPANRVLWALVKLMEGKPINQDYAPALCVKAS